MKIAIVSYFAPPQPAVASHRVLRLTRELLRAGHGVHWVTLDAETLDKRDPTLVAVTPAEVVVHGLGGPNLVDRDARGFLEKIQRTVIFALPDWLPVFDRHIEWSSRLRRRLPGIVREHGIDVVLLCCGPHGQLVAVDALRARCPRARIVVDYRDLLSGNTWRQSASVRLRQKVTARERRILSRVDALFLNNDDAKTSFDRSMGRIGELPVEVMRNTADYELGDRIAALGPAVRLGGGIHLGFFGTIFPRRRMKPVLDAMAALAPDVLARFTAHVYCDAGGSRTLLEEDLATVPESVRARVIRHELLGYGDALRAMRAMDVLLLVNSPDPADQIFVPGKLYDYLMARRPVLFFGEEGDAWRIVAETTGPQWCFTYKGTSEAAQLLTEIASRRPGDTPPSPAHVPATSFAPLLRLLSRWS
ncbi:MAG: glycosyltransferase [Planctomycetota bacterium]